jgi:hypothetical protein
MPACSVQLVVADVNGGSSSSMLQQVKDILITYRAAGIPVDVSGGTVLPQAVRWNVDFAAGIDQDAAREQVRAVTVAVTQFLRPGQTLFRSSLIAAAKSIAGVVVNDNSLELPVGDTVPSLVTQLIRTAPQDVMFV